MIRRRAGMAGIIEYVVVVAVTVAALLAMRVYVKRAVSGRLRQGADSLGEQYDPKRTTSNWTVTTKSDMTSTSTMQKDVTIDRHKVDIMTSETRMNEPEKTTRTGSETVQAMTKNLWN